MKNKLLKLIVAVMLIATSICVFTACNPDGGGANGVTKLTLDNVQSSTDKAVIEANIKTIFNVTVSLPTGTLSGAADTMMGVPVYKITVTDSEDTALDYFQALALALGEGWEVDDGNLMKTVDNSTIYISFMANSSDATTYEIYVYASQANDDGSVRYTYNVVDPTKTTYLMGETLDLTGFAVRRSGSDGSNVVLVKDVDYTIDVTAFDSTLAENQDEKVCNLAISLIGSDDFSGNVTVRIKRPDILNFEGIALGNYAADYDGENHSAAFTAPTNAEGYTVLYRFSDDFRATWSEWSAEVPSFKDVGNYIVNVKINKEGYNEYTTEATVEIRSKTFANAEELRQLYDNVSVEIGADASEFVPEFNEGLSIPDGATVKFATDDDNWTDTAPNTFTTAGTFDVYFKITKPGYATVQGGYKVYVSKTSFSVSLSYADELESAYNLLYFADRDDFVIIASPAIFHPVAELTSLSGTETGDVIEYCTDLMDSVGTQNPTPTWSTTKPTVDGSFNCIWMRVKRGDTAESNRVQVFFHYLAANTVEFDDLGITVSTQSQGANYNATEDSGLAPFHPHIGNEDPDKMNAIFTRYKKKVGGEWSDWFFGTRIGPETAGEFTFEYNYYREGVGKCEFSRDMTIDWTLDASLMNESLNTNDAAEIEKNLNLLTGEDILLPALNAETGSVTSTKITILDMPCYKVTVTDSQITLQNYFEALNTQLTAKGWTSSDGGPTKTYGDTIIYISYVSDPVNTPEMTSTTFDICVVYGSAV